MPVFTKLLQLSRGFFLESRAMFYINLFNNNQQEFKPVEDWLGTKVLNNITNIIVSSIFIIGCHGKPELANGFWTDFLKQTLET